MDGRHGFAGSRCTQESCHKPRKTAMGLETSRPVRKYRGRGATGLSHPGSEPIGRLAIVQTNRTIPPQARGAGLLAARVDLYNRIERSRRELGSPPTPARVGEIGGACRGRNPMKVVVAEKPSVARELASFLGASARTRATLKARATR